MDNCIRVSIDSMGNTRGGRRTLCAFVCVLALLMSPGAALAESGGTAKEGGLGAAAAISSLVYGPTKILYALGGTLIAGMSWCFSGGDSEVASTVLTRAVRGTYVITPDTLMGRDSIEFVGRSPEYRMVAPEAESQVAAAPDGW
jgi:hypothetical protein